MPRRPKSDQALANLVRKQQKTLDRAKQLYDRADNVLAEIVQPFLEKCKHCGGIKLKENAVIMLNEDGKKATLTDLFAGESVVWGHGGVRHYGIKITKS